MKIHPFSVRAPGKLILSGEHAVVHGLPVLAMAVDCPTRLDVELKDEAEYELNLPDLNFKQRLSKLSLAKINHRVKDKYNNFIKELCNISDVISSPEELLLVGLAHAMQTNHQAPGLTLTVSSDLPLGCGLGSSASVLAALMTALNRCFALEWDKAELYRETLVLENLQHGHSSGTDLTLCLEGGCLYIENGQTQLRPLPTLPFFLVNTGKPQCSTGECVEYASVLLQDGSLHEAFANSTQALDKALTQQDHASANKALRHNHRLLCQIGVVPKTIQGFIHAIEEKGLAAKICGSGAIFGEQAGILLVLGEKDKAASLLESYNYEAIDLLGDAHGTRIL